MNFVENNQYLIAWSVYVLAGMGCSIFWWKVTSFINNRGWRDLLRGLVVVLIFTPWYAGETTEFYAPALVVLMMDLLLEGANGGFKGGIALLFTLFFMLVGLTVRQFFRHRPQDV